MTGLRLGGNLGSLDKEDVVAVRDKYLQDGESSSGGQSEYNPQRMLGMMPFSLILTVSTQTKR